MKFTLKDFKWMEWIKSVVYANGLLSFVGAIIYSYGYKYNNEQIMAYGHLFWVILALPMELLLVFGLIFNYTAVWTWVKVKASGVFQRKVVE